MRALVLHGPGRLVVEERPDAVAKPGEVLLDVIATGICGSDLHGYTGENGRRYPGQVMGHETVGRVRSHGAGTSSDLLEGTLVAVNPVLACGECQPCQAGRQHWCPRRRVIGVDPDITAAFAELLAVPAGNVVRLAPGLAPELGALVEPLTVGYHAARRAPVREDDRVLVIGGGPIGQAAALAARRLGARTAVCELSATRRELVASLGFATLDAADEQAGDRACELLDGPPGVVIDAVGTSATVRQALTVSAIGATIVLVGMHAPEVSLAAYDVTTEERSLVGSFCYSAQEFQETANWLAGNAALATTLIDGHVDLEDGPRAFADLAAGRLDASKVLIHTNLNGSHLTGSQG